MRESGPGINADCVVTGMQADRVGPEIRLFHTRLNQHLASTGSDLILFTKSASCNRKCLIAFPADV
jgi:hypothetical protein